MIGLDTNILVRYFTQDDAAQAALANDLVDGLSEERPGYVTTIVLAETYWVLRHAYKTDRDAIIGVLQRLLESKEIVVEQADAARRAMRRAAGGADVAGALINEISVDAGCERTLTFHRRAAKATGMQLLG